MTVELLTWRALRSDVASQLRSAGIATGAIEARWITEHASGCEGAAWLDVERVQPTVRSVAYVESMTSRRVRGEPLQYVLGSWSFRGIDVMVDARVLIPRPETEWVVELALREAERVGLRRDRASAIAFGQLLGSPSRRVVADLGTGSAAIALALEAELPDVTVWATDASADALAVATANVAGRGAARVRCAQGDWFDALPEDLVGSLDLVVANPPYVTDAEHDSLAPEVRDHEPRRALVSGPTGLEAIEHLVAHAPRWLSSGAALVCELAPTQADAALALALRAGFAETEIHDDLTGRPRALIARR